MMKKIFFCVLLPLLFLCPVAYGQHDNSETTKNRIERIKKFHSQKTKNRTERIINFHSHIIIGTTGIIRVTETIKVFANRDNIKRGIVRSIPVYRTDMHGKKKKVKFDIISVSCNGAEEKYKTENAGEYKEIYIGRPDVYLKPGFYEYVITYESPGQIGFFDTYDELYWNVTGNEWVFGIEKASASVTLPNNGRSISASCYTGAAGSTEMRCSANTPENKADFKTNGALSAHEGFTIAVSFPRDIIKRPPPPTWVELLWEEYQYHVSALLCLSLFGIFFCFTWRKAGRNPEKPIVIPTFKPPHGWPPSAIRYLFKRKYDDRVFTAALVEMAVKGAIRITKTDKLFTLEPIERKENLREEEKEIYGALFKNDKSIIVSDKNHSAFAAANEGLTKSLQKNWNLEDYFRNNTKYVGWGTLLIPFLLILHIIMTAELPLAVIIVFTVPLIGFAAMLVTTKKLSHGSPIFIFKILGLFVFGSFSLFVTIAVLVIALLLLQESWVNGAFVPALLIAYVMYVFMIKAPTELGAQTASELKGFKMYLKMAEENRLNLLTPPEKTPELFEKLLPYAIALDVENAWGEKFTKILKQFNYEPDWYKGDKSFTASRFPASLSRSFTSSVGSARINPASKSSSGGSWSSGSSGGSSGGGGGGGGGRGW